LKPIDHPQFFQRPPPPGRSRESAIVLDRQGRFWNQGELVTHPSMATAFASWIMRHPDDGRFILCNGFDWTYFTVEDAPFFVKSVRVVDGRPLLVLSDGSEAPLDPGSLSVGDDEALYARVKSGAFEARFTPAAQLSLAEFFVAGAEGEPELEIAGRAFAVAKRRTP